MPYIPVQRGVARTLFFDSFTDTTLTTRISYEGWKYIVSVAVVGAPDVQWATDDEDPKLTVVSATNPDGEKLQLVLDATVTAGFDWSGGTVTVLQVDPADPTNVEAFAATVIRVTGAP